MKSKDAIRPLESSVHGAAGWALAESLAMTKEHSYAPATLLDLAPLLSWFPLAFVKRAEGRFQFVVLQGIHKNKNLLVDHTGKWRISLVPGVYYGYPFSLRKTKPAGGDVVRVVCFNHDSGLYREQPAEGKNEYRFFDDTNKPTQRFQHAIDFLLRWDDSYTVTQQATAILVERDLLVPWNLDEVNNHSGQQLLNGIYRIDEEKLKTVSNGLLPEVFHSQAMLLAYAQLLSLPRMHNLFMLNEAIKSEHITDENGAQLDVQGLFDGDESDTLNFDWLNK